MKVADLKGKAVVSMADGARVGTVEDMVVDGQALSLTGLVLGGEHGEGLLPFQQIRSNGPDAITIESSAAVQWNTGKGLTQGHEMSEFLRLTVVDAGGKVLGHVHDVVLDPMGSIESIVLKEGGVLGIGAHEVMISKARVRAVGPKLITVEGEAG